MRYRVALHPSAYRKQGEVPTPSGKEVVTRTRDRNSQADWPAMRILK